MTKITEGVVFGDLKRLVEPVMSIDKFRSKMGDDRDVVVAGITVLGKDPAMDLVNFLEKSYDWILDADVSSGETSDGNYMVFIEIERTKKSAEQLFTLITDLLNLTEQSIEDWRFSYYKDFRSEPVTLEALEAKIISSPDEYDRKVGDDVTESKKLDHMKAIAGVPIIHTKVVDPELLSVQRAAGIK